MSQRHRSLFTEYLKVADVKTHVWLWAWRRPLVQRMCRITKTQLEVLGISALDRWKSQPWTVVFTFPSRGQNSWSRLALSNAGQLKQPGCLSCRDYLEFLVRDCPKCLSLQQRQILWTDRSTVPNMWFIFWYQGDIWGAFLQCCNFSS